MKPRLLPDLLQAARLSGLPPLKDVTQTLQRALAKPAGIAETLRRALEPVLPGAAPRAPARTANLPGRFTAHEFSAPEGKRPYKLYVPSNDHGQPTSLIVMLHGCTQSPDDFAAGTRMNEAAEAGNFLVAYPGQIFSANFQKCWNWFEPADQARGSGEPALIAGIAREIMANHAIDPARVYVAGLSAGGAAAAIMGQAYPELFAAVGVHSGLACGAARDLPSAMAAMRGGSAGHGAAARRPVPTIVFHGTADATVNARNADQVAAQAAADAALTVQEDRGRSPGGHAYTRSLYKNASGRTVIEQWAVEGGGHAWFGGSDAGSYTDPAGPDATAEMVRFFGTQRL